MCATVCMFNVKNAISNNIKLKVLDVKSNRFCERYKIEIDKENILFAMRGFLVFLKSLSMVRSNTSCLKKRFSQF